MVRTLALAALVTLFGAGASQAQYQDSSPPDEQNGSPQYDNGYDEELLGPRHDDQRYNDDRQDNRGYAQPDIDVGIFASLGNDGRWFLTGNFGWVWRPYAAAGFRPYSDGRWVWTSYGWTWVSYEPFGWATYHYGYWNCDAALGWVWIPGYDWSACRVQWASYDNYVCWAPMTPPGYYCPRPFTTAGFSIWFTIGAHHFCDPYPARYCVTAYHPEYTQRVAYKSPDRGYVQQYTRAPIRTATVQFKYKSFVRGDGGQARFGSNREQTFAKSRSYTPQQQPYSNVQRGTSRPLMRDPRAYTQDSRQQYKSPQQRQGGFDTRALDTRPQAAAWKRQYQPQEARRAPSSRDIRPLFETHHNDAMRGGQRSQQQWGGAGTQPAQREDASTREAVRTANRGGGNKGNGREVVRMKGGDNGRGNGKH
jgi:hypothetical protein